MDSWVFCEQVTQLPLPFSSPALWSSSEACLPAGCQLEAVLTAIGLSHHCLSSSEFLIQGNSTVLKIVTLSTRALYLSHSTHKEMSKCSRPLFGRTVADWCSPTTLLCNHFVIWPPHHPLVYSFCELHAAVKDNVLEFSVCSLSLQWYCFNLMIMIHSH